MTALPVRPGPAVVHSGAGAVDELPGLLAGDGVARVLFVHGARSLAAAKPYLPALPGIELVESGFAGECSPNEISRLHELAVREGVDAVLGLGGGKVLDTAKAAGHGLSVPVYLVPTLASTCSGWSAITVYYDDEHRHLGHESWETPTRGLLLDPRIVFDSPVALFASGIADTLAKHVETRAAFARADAAGALTSFGALAAARCGELVVELGAAAIDDMHRGIRTEAWTTLAEAAVITAGLVGALGAGYGRATAAHPIGDALSALDPTRDLLHGVKVAYGILVQLGLEGRWSEIDELADVYAALGLPRSLDDLGLAASDLDALLTIAEVATGPHSSIHLLDPAPTPAELIATMRTLEAHQSGLDPVVLATHPS
ncbi:iron-containing alcohol dehydrogenase family protein [Microbacterium aurantiacum]|uniref:iron-containing alcohol dehydrogenase family protein n=1 Tax=Microbacterium aurantiacum TaxID=162393 RepID=UPI000C7FF5D9|nr:iron-containing alcohol dehydrogenase family protein [Microbacterium aurantiacum]